MREVAHKLTPITCFCLWETRPGPQTKQGDRGWMGACLLHEASQCPWVRGDSPREPGAASEAHQLCGDLGRPQYLVVKLSSQPSVTSNFTETPGAHVVCLSY